ncbi:TPA: phosphoglycerate dehydrogenase [Pseudomonas aeruginosa]
MSKTSLDKSKIKFLLLEGVHQNAVDTLKAAGYTNIEYLKTALSGDELKERIADAHFIGIRSRTQLTEEVFDCAKKLIAVGCFCIGTNQVDLNAARERGIAVFNAPYSNTRSVAELVLAEAILLLRGIPEKNASCHRGGWIKSAANSFEIRGKKLGIVGYGSIGTQLSVLAEALGMQVFFYDTVTKLPLGNAVQIGSLHELLGMSDIVSLHVPELPSTQWMIGEKEIRAMKKGGILINAARGTVVELDHLAAAIKDEHLIGAAIDVFPVEPKSNDEEFAAKGVSMRALLAFALLLVGLPALADPYQRLYQAAGWPDQRAHFSDALDAAQKRYQDKLPPALYQTLVDNSNRRFAPAEVDQRALNGLRENLPDSASPLNFFESPLGRKVVAAEVLATRRDQLLQHSNGLPRQTASEPRRALVKRLAQVLPAREAGAEVSLALAGVAADSLSQMLPGLPGLLGGGQTGQLLEGQRQRLVQQIGADLENTLLYVYRDLSDAELTQYVNFAESPAGRSYYQAALAALKAGLAVDQAVAP